MPEPTKIPRPFADSGDKNSIPDSTGSIGFASWQEGFPAITGTPFAQGGVAPKRADFNGIFNALSAATVWTQQGGVYAYDATTDYEVGNVVEYSGDLYKCITANGPSSTVKDPTNTTVWDAIATASGYLPLSGGTISGTIVATTHPALSRQNDNSYLTLCGGTTNNVANGAFMYLYGAGAGQPGAFRIYTGGTSHNLFGKSDGTLTWDGDDVFTAGNCTLTSDTANQPYHYKLKLVNGFMLQATYSNAFVTDSNARVQWTYDEAFLEDPFCVVLKTNAAQSINMYSVNKTRAIYRINDMSGANIGSGVTTGFMSIAIGRWK